MDEPWSQLASSLAKVESLEATLQSLQDAGNDCETFRESLEPLCESSEHDIREGVKLTGKILVQISDICPIEFRV